MHEQLREEVHEEATDEVIHEKAEKTHEKMNMIRWTNIAPAIKQTFG